MSDIETPWLNQLDAFTAFVRGRVKDPQLAADVVQESLLKALKAAGQLRDAENLNAWFYRILRRTIIDLYRRRQRENAMIEHLESEVDRAPTHEENQVICACINGLIETLEPVDARLIRALDLEEEDRHELAMRMGMTANHLRVRHHRARQKLRSRLESLCGLCATHGCIDCSCDPAS